jgi:hypothetical protein
MASGLWGFENVPELYVPRARANPIGEGIGGGIGEIFAAVAQGKQADKQRAMALQRMRQEQGQFDARMGMDKSKMASEEARANARLALDKEQNAAQQWNWNDEQSQRRAAAEALQSEKQGARQASPVTGTIEGVKDISQEPEMAGVGSLLQTAQAQSRDTGNVTLPQFATRGGMPSQALQDAFAKGAEPRMSTVSPEQFTQDIAPNIADAGAQMRARQANEKARAAAAGRPSMDDRKELIILKAQAEALIEAAKGGKMPDAMGMMLIEKLGLRGQFDEAVRNRKVDLTNVVPEIRNLYPIGGRPQPQPQPNQTSANRPSRTINGVTKFWNESAQRWE